MFYFFSQKCAFGFNGPVRDYEMNLIEPVDKKLRCDKADFMRNRHVATRLVNKCEEQVEPEVRARYYDLFMVNGA